MKIGVTANDFIPSCTMSDLLCRASTLGPFRINTIDDLIAAETMIDIKGCARAICPICNAVEEIALFDGGNQVEPWMNADETERRFGRGAGPLPPLP